LSKTFGRKSVSEQKQIESIQTEGNDKENKGVVWGGGLRGGGGKGKKTWGGSGSRHLCEQKWKKPCDVKRNWRGRRKLSDYFLAGFQKTQPLRDKGGS